MTAIKSEKYKK